MSELISYPPRCSQCGQRWADQACGPTHALIAEEFGIGELRRKLEDINEGHWLVDTDPGGKRYRVDASEDFPFCDNPLCSRCASPEVAR